MNYLCSFKFLISMYLPFHLSLWSVRFFKCCVKGYVVLPTRRYNIYCKNLWTSLLFSRDSFWLSLLLMLGRNRESRKLNIPWTEISRTKLFGMKLKGTKLFVLKRDRRKCLFKFPPYMTEISGTFWSQTDRSQVNRRISHCLFIKSINNC